jgi:hypothetical protein
MRRNPHSIKSLAITISHVGRGRSRHPSIKAGLVECLYHYAIAHPFEDFWSNAIDMNGFRILHSLGKVRRGGVLAMFRVVDDNEIEHDEIAGQAVSS